MSPHEGTEWDEFSRGSSQSLDEGAIKLSDYERNSLRRECYRRSSGVLSLPLDDEHLLSEAELVGCNLPERVLRTLGQFRRFGNEIGGLVISNIPIDRSIPATPGGGCLPHWNAVPVATFAQLAVSSRLGDVIAYADEKGGSLIQEIVPVKGTEKRQENSGTVDLDLHTEDGFHPHRPDFLTLLCLRPDHQSTGRTLLGAAARVLPLLPDDCISTLREPLFFLRTSSSFGDLSPGMLTPPFSVLSGSIADMVFIADFHAMVPLNARAHAALDLLKNVLLASLHGAVLGTGDLLVIDNRAAVHGRTGFDARFDGRDRWLRRCFTVTDLRRSQGARAANSRVCRPLATIGFSP